MLASVAEQPLRSPFESGSLVIIAGFKRLQNSWAKQRAWGQARANTAVSRFLTPVSYSTCLVVEAPASIAFSGSRQHSAKYREVHIATGEDQADTFAQHAVALLEQCRQRCGASPLRDIVSVGEQMAHRRLDLIL